MSALRDLSVLVVDDDSDSRLLLTYILETEGAQVTAVASSNEALAFLVHHEPDVLLSDIAMPEIDGYSLIRQVRSQERGKQIPAIAVTALAESEAQEAALAAGFHMHLVKPIDPAHLVDAISQFLSTSLCA